MAASEARGRKRSAGNARSPRLAGLSFLVTARSIRLFGRHLPVGRVLRQIEKRGQLSFAKTRQPKTERERKKKI